MLSFPILHSLNELPLTRIQIKHLHNTYIQEKQQIKQFPDKQIEFKNYY